MIKIIFCSLNEEKNLPILLSEIVKNINFEYQIIACIDASCDNSEVIINDFFKKNNDNFSGYLLENINQKGLGVAYKRLLNEVIKNSDDEDLIISLDADNTHKPSQINDMIDYFNKNNLDLLIASRFCNDSFMKDFPYHRKLISKSTSFILSNLFKVKNIRNQFIKDFTSGYRVYRAKKLKELKQKLGNKFIEEPQFTYTCELLIKLFLINAKIDEIAIDYDYGKKIGISKLRFLPNFKRLIIMIFKLKFLAKSKNF